MLAPQLRHDIRHEHERSNEWATTGPVAYIDALQHLPGSPMFSEQPINRNVELKDYRSATFTLKSGETRWYHYSFRDPDGEMIALWDGEIHGQGKTLTIPYHLLWKARMMFCEAPLVDVTLRTRRRSPRPSTGKTGNRYQRVLSPEEAFRDEVHRFSQIPDIVCDEKAREAGRQKHAHASSSQYKII